jgi:hypothetical protein
MKSEFTEDFKNLHTAALSLSTRMLAALQQAELDAIERATKQGARVVLQLGPLPSCQRVELVLLEREGARHVLASLGAAHD